MEFDLKDNTLFLEFYGLPGCGKSTISHVLAEELLKLGKTVREPSYDLDHKYIPSVRKIIKFLNLFRFALRYPKNYKQLLLLIRTNGYTGSKVFSQAANISYKLLVYNYSKSNFIIFDEGITQSAISLVMNKINSLENEQIIYNLCKKRTVQKFYVKVSPDIALSRMNDREKHDSRIELIRDINNQNCAVRAFETQCNLIQDGFVVEEESIQSAVIFILSQIGESINNG